MSIKKPGKNINIYILSSGFYFLFFTFFLLKFSCFGWYAENRIDDALFFLNCQKNNDELSSDRYAVYENALNQKCMFPAPMSSESSPLAGAININIPLSRLSKESVEPSKYLDRLIAVNLRIKNLVEEYEKIRKKADLLVKSDSPVFFSEKHNAKSGLNDSKKKREIHVLKEKLDKNLQNLVNFSPKADLAASPVINGDVSKKEIKSLVHDYSSALSNQSRDRDSAFSSEKINVERSLKTSTELPWIFKFFIGILKFIRNYKYEILFLFLFCGFSVFLIIGRSGR
jgi:hypothetical protein